MFSQLKAYLYKRNVNMQEIISEHLEQLTKKLKQHYDDAITPTNKQDWMIDPFTVTNFPELPIRVAKKLMEITAEASNHLSSKSSKKKRSTLSENIYFGVSMCPVYPTMSKFVIKQLIPFATTYLCEAGFSAMSVLKTKHRNWLNVEVDMCFRSRFQKLTDNMQEHRSHWVY